MAVGKAAQESWLGELCTIGGWGRGVAAVSDQISGLREKIPLIQTESENYTSYPFLKLFVKSRILVWGLNCSLVLYLTFQSHPSVNMGVYRDDPEKREEMLLGGLGALQGREGGEGLHCLLSGLYYCRSRSREYWYHWYWCQYFFTFYYLFVRFYLSNLKLSMTTPLTNSLTH